MQLDDFTKPKRTDGFDNTMNWELVDSDVFSTKHMDDEELIAAVIADITSAGYDKECGAGEMPLSKEELLRFIDDDTQQKRVLEALNSPTVQRLLDAELLEGGLYMIKNTPETLQKAMDISGVYLLDREDIVYPDDLIQGTSAVDAYINYFGDEEEALKAILDDLSDDFPIDNSDDNPPLGR